MDPCLSCGWALPVPPGAVPGMILTVVDPGAHDLFLGNLGYLTQTTIELKLVTKL